MATIKEVEKRTNLDDSDFSLPFTRTARWGLPCYCIAIPFHESVCECECVCGCIGAPSKIHHLVAVAMMVGAVDICGSTFV